LRLALFLPIVVAPLLATSVSTTPAFADEIQVCIDASDRGQTLRIDRHLREASDAFAQCARAACPDEVRTKCGEWLDQTQRALPTIVFVVKDGLGNDVTPVRVTMDGLVATESYDGAALAVNPGEHSFRFDWGGNAPATRVFRLVEGEKNRLERVVFATASVEPRRDAGTPTSGASAMRTAGVVVAIAGLAGIGAGSAFGIAAISKNDAAHCDAGNVCANPQDRRDAQGVATASTIAFAAGGALLVGGLVLYFTAPKTGGVTARKIAPSPLALLWFEKGAGVGLGGSF
jgi:hypothetical protein